MNAEISVFVTYVETIKYFLLYNLHDCVFKQVFTNPAELKLWKITAF